MTKKSKIYAFDRQSSINTIVKDAKKTPGTGKYETTRFDEKYCRPPRGLHKASVERITVLEEAQIHGRSIPDKYPEVELNVIKRRPYQQVKYHPETDIAKEKEARAWKKNNSPSPTTYKVDKAHEKTCGFKF